MVGDLLRDDAKITFGKWQNLNNPNLELKLDYLSSELYSQMTSS